MRFIFWCLGCFSLSAAQIDVEVKAHSAILMNADTGAILFEKHAHIPCYPASTTKIATALYILETKSDLNQTATVSRASIKIKGNREESPSYWLESDGTMMGLKVGEIVSLHTLLHGLMMVSGNDAANVLAETVGGTIPDFMERLNEYLQGIGCKNTQFSNPHGLTHSTHWSTAYDLAVMTKRALQFPLFREIVAKPFFIKPGSNKQPEEELKQLNPLMKAKSRYYYPKAIGVKTGYTSAAQYNLVAAAEQEGRTLIAVLLGCKERGARYEDAKKLFEVAFAEVKTSRRLIGPENVFRKEVEGAKNCLKAAVARPLSISFFPSEEPKCKAALHWEALECPIRKGQKVGEVRILDEREQLLQKGDLVALDEVQSSFFLWMKSQFLKLFAKF